MNPFMLVLAVMNVGAAAWYLHKDDWKLAVVVTCYAVASVFLGMK